MNKEKIVAGLGQCSLDYITFVDGYPLEDSKHEVSPWFIQGGGPVATALVALSRLGIKTRFMGIVSDDNVGRQIRAGLKDENVDVLCLLEETGGQSQMACIIVNRNTGSRTIFWNRPTVQLRDLTKVPETSLEAFLIDVSILHLDGLMEDVSIELASRAHSLGIPVMLDAGSLRQRSLELIPMCNYVVASERFSREMSANHEETLKILLRMGVCTATITLGAQGSITLQGDRLVQQPAYKVQVVDTTGAGDVFHGGYIYGLLMGWPIKEILRFSSAVAAIKCTKPGGRSGIPSFSEAMGFINSHNVTQDI
ncbi:MAG: sugar kinase [Nitrospirae bacterium]|nr:sugar kinase [Nitrospirota bacterium]